MREALPKGANYLGIETDPRFQGQLTRRLLSLTFPHSSAPDPPPTLPA